MRGKRRTETDKRASIPRNCEIWVGDRDGEAAMKVFISWSGDISREVASVFNEWLPQVFQSVEPFFSPDNIEKGTRWSHILTRELAESSIGLFCVTSENLDSRWLNYEAGAISKALEGASGIPRVMPFLFGIKKSEVQWPLADFQMTVQDRDDVWKLVLSMNRASGTQALDEVRLTRSFAMWWPSLETQLGEITERLIHSPKIRHHAHAVSSDQILEELLELAREQARILTSIADQPGLQPKKRPVLPLPRGNMLELIQSWNAFSTELISEMMWSDSPLGSALGAVNVMKALSGLAVNIDRVYTTVQFDAYKEKESEDTRQLINIIDAETSTNSPALGPDDSLEALEWDDSEPPF